MAVISLIGPAYAALRTRKREKQVAAYKQIEAEMLSLKLEFDNLIYRATDEGNTPSQLAREMGASRSTVYDILKRRPTAQTLVSDPLAEFVSHDDQGRTFVTVEGETHEVDGQGHQIYAYTQGPSGEAWDKLPDKASSAWKTWVAANLGQSVAQ